MVLALAAATLVYLLRDSFNFSSFQPDLWGDALLRDGPDAGGMDRCLSKLRTALTQQGLQADGVSVPEWKLKGEIEAARALLTHAVASRAQGVADGETLRNEILSSAKATFATVVQANPQMLLVGSSVHAGAGIAMHAVCEAICYGQRFKSTYQHEVASIQALALGAIAIINEVNANPVAFGKAGAATAPAIPVQALAGVHAPLPPPLAADTQSAIPTAPPGVTPMQFGSGVFGHPPPGGIASSGALPIDPVGLGSHLGLVPQMIKLNDES